MKGTFTRLKKYNKPTQVIPATKCTQRISMAESAADPGGLTLGAKNASRVGRVIFPPMITSAHS
jgi:hypothetical protein